VPVNAGLARGAYEPTTVFTNAVDAAFVELSVEATVGTVIEPPVKLLAAENVFADPTNAPPTPLTSEACRVTAPVRVLNDVTPALVNADLTKAVVAKVVELSEVAGVGAVGVPVSAGLAKGAPPAPVISAVVNVTAPVRVLNDVTPPGPDPSDCDTNTRPVPDGPSATNSYQLPRLSA
jgi:hypothetical protein